MKVWDTFQSPRRLCSALWTSATAPLWLQHGDSAHQRDLSHGPHVSRGIHCTPSLQSPALVTPGPLAATVSHPISCQKRINHTGQISHVPTSLCKAAFQTSDASNILQWKQKGNLIWEWLIRMFLCQSWNLSRKFYRYICANYFGSVCAFFYFLIQIMQSSN